MNQFIRYCLVGVVGFVIDAGILQALVSIMHTNPYAARIASFLCAANSTWLMNRCYTFKVQNKPSHKEWLCYVGSMILGALVNYSAFAICITFWIFAHTHLWLAVAIGSIAGLGINFTTSKLIFLKTNRLPDIH